MLNSKLKAILLAGILIIGICFCNTETYGAILKVRSQYWTIQDAIDASSNGDTVLVEDGLYQLTEPIDFTGKAITVISENGYANCTIDGQWPGFNYPDVGGWSCVKFVNFEGNDSVLSGFQIISGTKGGIYIAYASPTIENCWIRRNATRDGGGGIYSVEGSPIIKNSIINMNNAYTLSGSIGGGGLAFDGGNPSLINCAINNNRAEDIQGGGIFGNNTSLSIINCSIVNNIGYWQAGGGGIHVEGNSTLTITNSILWQNFNSEISQKDSSTVTITYSDIADVWPGEGNISTNPNFAGDYYILSSSSPCIDAGTDVNAPPIDIEGKARPQGDGIDMGAYEYPISVTSTNPVNGAANVAVDTTITATFSGEMDASTITTSTFLVNDGSGNIAGAVSYAGKTATFTPAIDLDYDTGYTATITTGAQDLLGNSLQTDYIWSFATPDSIPPVVNATSPTDGATDVVLNTLITATFSEPMDASTITTSTFLVNDGSGNIAGSVSYAGTTATFTPSVNLVQANVYTVTITTGATDLSGNALLTDYTWSFTTLTDTSPPTVNSTNPLDGAIDVSVDATISAIFSEEMDASTIDTNTFTLDNGVTGTVNYSAGTMMATFIPSANLDYNTTYTVTITTGVEDLALNPLQADYTWLFTTVAAPDTTPPTVTSTSPLDSATGVAVDATISATFSEDMDASTIDASSFTLNNGATGTISYNAVSRTATCTPIADLNAGTNYTATITTGAEDSAGNPLQANFTWSFTTQAAGIGASIGDEVTEIPAQPLNCFISTAAYELFMTKGLVFIAVIFGAFLIRFAGCKSKIKK
jgi:hypothetical protein